MYQATEIVQNIKKAAKRRLPILIITPILFVALSIIALNMIEPKYKSSTSILVQKEETLNPLVLYEMAVNIASEDRLKSFNEIIYSRTTIELLVDSLNLAESITSEIDRQALIANLRNNISTSSRASDSFEISFIHPDPVKARDGAEMLADHFIQTRLRLENRRNTETVDFFSDKLNELEAIVEEQRDQVVNVTANRMREMPVETGVLQSRLQEIDTQMETIDWRIYQNEQNLRTIEEFQNRTREESTGNHIQILYRLPLTETPLGAELGELFREYDQVRQQYTENFPRARSLMAQIIQTVNRIPPVVESNLSQLEIQKSELSEQRNYVINDMERSYIATQRANTQQSDFNIYESLYNEMRVKLEQARMTRDIGSRAAEQFVVLDHPFVSETPDSPNRMLILLFGIIFGGVIAVVASGVAEVMDTTLRDDEYLQFDKPVIAYLTDGN